MVWGAEGGSEAIKGGGSECAPISSITLPASPTSTDAIHAETVDLQTNSQLDWVFRVRGGAEAHHQHLLCSLAVA